MDGLNSFYDTDAGLERLVRTESTAMIVDGPIHSFKEYHCQVHTNSQFEQQVPYFLI